MIVEVIVCTAVAVATDPSPTLEVDEVEGALLVDEELVMLVVFAPSAGAGGGGVAELRALMFAYIVNSTLGGNAALFEEGRLPPQYSVLLPGHGLPQLARFWIALVPTSRVLAQ